MPMAPKDMKSVCTPAMSCDLALDRRMGKRDGPRSNAEINACLRAIIDRMGDPGRSARDLADEVKAEEVRKYGRALTLKERLEVLKKRTNQR